MRAGNKTKTGGLDQTQVDARVTTLVQKIALAANEGKAVRVDTGVAEAPQVGVIYYATQPYNFFAGARMQRFTGTGGGASVVLIASGVSKPIASWGWHTNGTSGNSQTHGQASNTSLSNFNSAIVVDGGALVLERGASLDESDDSYNIMAVYIPA